jgi:hypothetical protein
MKDRDRIRESMNRISALEVERRALDGQEISAACAN